MIMVTVETIASARTGRCLQLICGSYESIFYHKLGGWVVIKTEQQMIPDDLAKSLGLKWPEKSS